MGDKILYLHGVTAVGGAEQDLLTIINGLDRKQLTAVVVCSDRGPLAQKLEASGVQVTILPLPS